MVDAIRDGFGKGLLEAGKKYRQVVALTADLKGSTKCNYFAEKFPLRFFECGITEQNMMSMAAGMANIGKIPFVNSFAVFSPGRNWDQLRVSVCYSDMNVKIHGSHAGITVGEDGATHQALEDIAITRVLPNIVVLVPCDAEEAKSATLAAAEYRGPVYIRTSRIGVPLITSKKTFSIGKADVLKKGTDVTIIACGVEVHEALSAAEKLEQKHISAEVINCSTIKPLDTKTILRSLKKTQCVVTAEEHQIHGGLGSAISELLVQKFLVPQEFVAVQDVFGESGSYVDLLKKYKLDATEIYKKSLKVLRRKNK